MRYLVRAVFTALTRACNIRLENMHTQLVDGGVYDEYDDSLEWSSGSECGSVAAPSPCTVLLSDIEPPVFEFHSQRCAHVLTRFGLMSGLVNHDLKKQGWAGDHGTVFDAQGFIAATFYALFVVFEEMGLQPKLSKMQEQACVCACLTLALKFTRRSALWAMPACGLGCDPRRVKLGNVFRILYERGIYSEESLHTLVENWESFLLRSSLSLFRCCTANAAALAELRLYQRFRDDPDTKRVSVLRDVASFLFLGLNVGGSDLLKMTTSVDLNIVLTTAIATAAIAVEDLTKYFLSEPESFLAMRIIREVFDSPRCHQLLTQARAAETIGFLFQDSNIQRAVRMLGRVH